MSGSSLNLDSGFKPGLSAVHTTASMLCDCAHALITTSTSKWPEFLSGEQKSILFMLVLSRRASENIAKSILWIFWGDKLHQRTGTGVASSAMTKVIRPFSDSRANSTGRSGPSQFQEPDTGRQHGFQTSDPQPKQAMFMCFFLRLAFEYDRRKTTTFLCLTRDRQIRFHFFLHDATTSKFPPDESTAELIKELHSVSAIVSTSDK